MSEQNSEEAGEDVRIANEYGQVTIQKVTNGKGERLQITAPGLGYDILLDPLQLESLTWQDNSSFSTFLSDPYGPDHE